MEQFLKTIPRPEKIICRDILLDETFLDFAGRFSHLPGTVLLAGDGSADCARHNLLALFPWLTVTAKNGRVTLRADDRAADFTLPPLTAVKKILARFHVNVPAPSPPVAAGLFGYLAYDLKDSLERLPRTSVDDLGLPDMYLIAPRLILVHDNVSGQTQAWAPDFTGSDAAALIDDFQQRFPAPPGKKSYRLGPPTANFRQSDYQAAVARIIDYIAAGDVYQVNLSQRFEAEFSGDPFRLFTALFRRNPAPFFAYVHANDHHIVSTSPERFVRQAGDDIETRPIKGTRPRGGTREQDEENRQALLASTKDAAELAMIVDLLRNDLGKVCAGGSVRVTEHKKLETYDNVFHLVAVVEGRLAQGKDCADLIEAVFPGGSITGCPKIRAMEIIDELEPCRRHIYTGSIGYIGFHDTLDLSIAIRTAVIRDDRLYYAAGGGIVYDSDPADEYAETLAKAATVLDIMKKGRTWAAQRPYIWVNGRLTDETCIPFSVHSPGFQYGAGLFETIRADQGEARFLKAHLERFETSWRTLFKTPAPDITWPDVIDQVLKKNGLTNGPGAVKIMVVHGSRQEPPWDHTLVVTARPYTHRLTAVGKPGLGLAVYPHPRLIHTADHKTMNYLYYYLAGKWAAAEGKDEALILNPDGTVSETNTANILLIGDKEITIPRSPSVLPGVTCQAVMHYLAERGYSIRQAAVSLDQCRAAHEIILTNSLMGAVPVLTIDDEPLGKPSPLCREINVYLGIRVQ